MVRRAPSERGFVLVNALLIVAAMAAAAALLLGRSQAARVRLDLAQEATQLQLYLDGAEALALTVLNRDLRGPALDHPEESWARPHDVAVDRGRVALRLIDLQGRFNLNALRTATDLAALNRFVRLAGGIALSEPQARAIAAHIAGPPPDLLGRYARLPVPMYPTGGGITAIGELRHVPGLGRAAFDRLQQVAAVLPDGAPLNVNTAPEPVLAAWLPELGTTARAKLLAQRRDAPFETPEAFLDALERLIAIDRDAPHLQPQGFTVESNWFLVESAASLATARQTRHSVIQRVGARRLARVVYRQATQERAEP